tara:strand:- start:330 stop:860 length:531 start_codon:yes stop_codon:yes gene_type:complete
MKTLEFIYQETQIHFLVNPTENNVMVNATEMAKMFGRRTKDYLKAKSTKDLIEALERAPNGARSEAKIVENRGHIGIYFERRLALDFAAWLDVNFRVWVFSTLDEIIFGNYKKHWEASIEQESAKTLLSELRERLLTAPTPELAREYFLLERRINELGNIKRQAISNQTKLNFPSH